MGKVKERTAVPEGELHLPDEDRYWWLNLLPRCPVCAWVPKLHRKTIPKGKFWSFSVGCANPNCSKFYNTPYLESSEKARAAWRLSVALAKP